MGMKGGGHKKGGIFIPPPVCIQQQPLLAKNEAVVPCPVGQDRGIEHFAAAAALPGVKGPYEIVEFFSVHTTFAFGTIHIGTLHEM
jgi:hypothetical protein